MEHVQEGLAQFFDVEMIGYIIVLQDLLCNSQESELLRVVHHAFFVHYDLPRSLLSLDSLLNL